MLLAATRNMARTDTILRCPRPFFESFALPNAESARFPVQLTSAWSFVLRESIGQEFPSLVTTRASPRGEISLLAEKCITLRLGSTNLFDGHVTVV